MIKTLASNEIALAISTSCCSATDSELADEPADIAGLLTTAPIGIDELIRQSGGGAAAVQLALLEMEIAGKLVRHAAGRVSLCS